MRATPHVIAPDFRAIGLLDLADCWRVGAVFGLLPVAVGRLLLRVPAHHRPSFMTCFWAFTFSWTAVTFADLACLAVARPGAWRAESSTALALVSAFIGPSALRTAVALRRGQILPAHSSPISPAGPVAAERAGVPSP